VKVISGRKKIRCHEKQEKIVIIQYPIALRIPYTSGPI
jgi:hypothetical protein